MPHFTPFCQKLLSDPYLADELSTYILRYAEKYVITPQAQAVVASLMPNPPLEGLPVVFPSHSWWIEAPSLLYPTWLREKPEHLGFQAIMMFPQDMSGCIPKQVGKLLNAQLGDESRDATPTELEDSADTWHFMIYTKGILIVSFRRASGQLVIREEDHVCPFGQHCPTETAPHLCHYCGELLAFSVAWFNRASLLIQRKVGVVEEDRPYEEQEIPYRRRVPCSNPKKKKYQEGMIRYTYVDVSLPPSRKQPAEAHHGPWTAIDPDTIMYVSKSIAETTRTLDPARNPRWKYKRTVSVAGHDKRVPMRITTIKKVIASRFNPIRKDTQHEQTPSTTKKTEHKPQTTASASTR